jgi:tetratricopeptide (TPR) repeat protein
VKKVRIWVAVIVILALAAPTVMAQENRALWNKSTYVQSAKIIYQTQYRQQKTRDIMYLSIDLLKEANSRFGRDPELSFMLGTFYSEIGLLDTMVMYFDSVETLCADTTIPEKLRANCYKGKDNYTGKMAGFRQKFWEESYNDAVENLRQYDTVAAMMERGVNQDSTAIYDSLKSVAYSRGVADFDQAARMKPNDPKSYDGKGVFLEREKKYPEAIDEYKKVIKLSGENAKDVSKIAYAYISIPDWKNSIIWFERLVDYDPQNVSALVNLSICYNSLGDYDKSYEYTEKILALEPENLQALYNAGQYWFLKMQQAASDLSEIADSTAGADAKRKELDAQIIDYRTKSETNFERITAVNPQDKDALKRLGILYLLSQQNEKAIDAFTKFIALDPGDAGVLDYLGRTYIQMGNFKDAVSPYEKLVEADPGNVEGWERLEELYRYTNQPEKADQAKAKATELRKL